MKIGEAYVNLMGYRSVIFTSPTSLTVHWNSGIVGVYTGTEEEVSFAKMVVEAMDGFEERQVLKLRDHGDYYREIEKAKIDQAIKDYDHQCADLREQGIYSTHGFDLTTFDIQGRYTLQITKDGDKGSTTLSGEIRRKPVE